MTNREKYINNASDEELASKLIELERKFHSFKWRKTYEELIKWLQQEAEETADEMFEKLGYEKYEHDAYDEFDSSELYYTKQQNENVKKKIEILKEMSCYKCYTVPENSGFEYINKEEDKAIHKKIEELENLNGEKT